ncbi:G2/mitotic-specific cyclin-2-like isoform X2 [Malania oleifera]|uniref:G2/mitotic-specific cyclin-2-like isoform X2 n=1 Tax=Malania oleifera TaxID=397392 RepID=UPI0025AE575C|nr:G2/mitotic-specific cyclin-2-like isoform X2 [Malania oleifera]
MFGSEVSQNIVAAGAPPLVVNKRGLPELLRKICKENMPDHQVHRPISRSFIAQMGSTQHQFSVESKRINTSVQDSIRVEDCNLIICADEKNDAKDQPEPMFLEQTDQIVKHEMGQMEEVKMKDLCEDPVMDIDTCDVKNPLEIVDYVEDIYAYYKKMECSGYVPPDYMAQQFDINGKMRDILIDWLIEVHNDFELREETLFLTVNLVDRFLAQQRVDREKLQLVGLTAMLLACKYENFRGVLIENLIFISGSACARKELLDMERLMLKTLQFNLSCPTPYVFMRRFLKAAQSDKKLEILSFFLIDLCLVEYEMLKFPPSLLAASAIYTAQCTLHGFKQWDKKCQWYTGYSEDELLECSVLIVTFHQKAGTGKLIGLQRKYSASRFGFTAKYEPAKFLLEGIQV